MQVTAITPTPNHESLILTSQIKVLHIISGDLWAGAEVQAFTLIGALKDSCNITVALMNHGELEERLKHAGITTVVINEQVMSSISITRQLTGLIKQLRPDIIHTHRQKENILGSIANLVANKSIFHRTKSLRTTHGAPEYTTKGLKKITTWLDIFCGKYLQDAVIAVSHDLDRQLQRIFPKGTIHVIPNGIDTDSLRKLAPAEDIRANAQNHAHVGIIGRLEPVKRVDLFIQAAHRIITQHPEQQVRFHIIGDGKLKNELMKLTQQLKIDAHVIFHGHRRDSTRAIVALDFVVMCSDHEGTPMTALEALALGKPLIAHNVGGLKEILDEHPELLVDQHTPDGYSAKILHLLRHRFTIELKSKYSSQQNAKQTLSLYQTLKNQVSNKLTSTN